MITTYRSKPYVSKPSRGSSPYRSSYPLSYLTGGSSPSKPSSPSIRPRGKSPTSYLSGSSPYTSPKIPGYGFGSIFSPTPISNKPIKRKGLNKQRKKKVVKKKKRKSGYNPQTTGFGSYYGFGELAGSRKKKRKDQITGFELF